MKRNTGKDTERLWWFNPQNDLALAADTPYYTPPKAAAELARAGELLPMWLAAEKDMIQTNGVNAHWLDTLSERTGVSVNLWNRSTESLRPTPWGWSAAARTHFIQSGFEDKQCPSDAELAEWRNLSGRATAENIDKHIFPETFKKRVVRAESDLDEILAGNGDVVIKTPWSCSGRGVSFHDGRRGAEIRSRVNSIIRSYGYATVEPKIAVQLEFGLLFEYDGEEARLYGLSRTISGPGGKYSGNVVETPAVHKAVIDNMAGEDGFTDTLASKAARAIAETLGDAYHGPIGLDFILGDGEVHLCEHNLRYTMGFVCAGIYEKTGLKGLLTVEKASTGLNSSDISLTQPGTELQFVLHINA
ncbi:MAG: hypothetical protein K2M19_05660 [Muribaculaceae bacterium]|nr:hypothetical protein [Muribaculaceae bacterium]